MGQILFFLFLVLKIIETKMTVYWTVSYRPIIFNYNIEQGQRCVRYPSRTQPTRINLTQVWQKMFIAIDEHGLLLLECNLLLLAQFIRCWSLKHVLLGKLKDCFTYKEEMIFYKEVLLLYICYGILTWKCKMKYLKNTGKTEFYLFW